MRCHGRLENSDLGIEAKHPMPLPKRDRFTELMIDHIHRRSYHSGVTQTLAQIRHRYLIPQGRSAVKRVLKVCTVCRRW